MSYYILEKNDQKAYGAFEEKQQAIDTIYVSVEGMNDMLSAEVKVNEVIDEYHLFVGDELVSVFEVVEEDQLELDLDMESDD